ncbi:hypothetical protein [Actinomadura macra]|uniref:hypothetical protein n=1 Tax=Actinomadura macra TaxID=46164 RepID=UPI00082E7AA1|nr:hypothetical protein [Actinomadura macra]
MSMALVWNPGDGKPFRYYNSVMDQVVESAETDGVVSVLRLTMRPEDAPPLHTRSREDASWVVLSGRVRFWVGSDVLDECDVHDAEAGAPTSSDPGSFPTTSSSFGYHALLSLQCETEPSRVW